MDNSSTPQQTSVTTLNLGSVGNPSVISANNPASSYTSGYHGDASPSTQHTSTAVLSASPLTPVEINLQLAAQEEVVHATQQPQRTIYQPQQQHQGYQSPPVQPQQQQQLIFQQQHFDQQSPEAVIEPVIHHRQRQQEAAPAQPAIQQPRQPQSILRNTNYQAPQPIAQPTQEVTSSNIPNQGVTSQIGNTGSGSPGAGLVLSSTRPLVARKSLDQPSPPRESAIQPSSVSAVHTRPGKYYREHHEAHTKVEMASLCNLFADEIDRVVSRFLTLMSRDSAYLILLAVGSAFAALYMDISPIWMMIFIALVSVVLFKYLRL